LGISKLDLRLFNQRLVGFNGVLQLPNLCLLGVEKLWRCVSLAFQLRVATEVCKCICKLGLVAIARAGHLIELRLKGMWVDLGEQIAGANSLTFGERDPRELSLDLAADDIGVIRDDRADTAQVNRHVLAAHLPGDDGYRRWCGRSWRRGRFMRSRKRAGAGDRDRQND
jgi:hypothetical protein